MDDEQRGAGGFAIDVDDGADISGAGGAGVDDVAPDEVVDVDGVVFEGGALIAGDGYVESAQGIGVVDGVDAGELEDNAPLVQPVAFEFDGARFSVWREQ